jgi:G:T-mismatch repair DNA endonuclease (very short patch repair protein)
MIFFCKRHNIARRGIKEAAQTSITRDLYKKSVADRYGDGITNVSQAKSVKEKKKQINLDRYGVENPFQRIDVKNKIKEVLLEKYGVENPIHIPDRKNWASYTRLTKPHKKISNWLTEIGVDHINDMSGKFKKYSEYLARDYCPVPDIFIPSKNIVIEIYGDRWHMNPAIYKNSDVAQFFGGERSAAQIWEFDTHREDHLRSFVKDVIIIWESDIKHNFEQVKNHIREKLCIK